MSFSVLPLELIRMIVTQNDERSLLTASIVNKSINRLNLHKLLFPVQLEAFFDVMVDNPVTLDERKKMHKHIKDSTLNLFKRRRMTKGQNEKYLLSLYYTYDYIETLNSIIGDRTKYDSPYNIYRIKKSGLNWKVLGFMNYEHFSNTNKTDKNMNIWNNSKNIGVRIAGSKSLQALI